MAWIFSILIFIAAAAPELAWIVKADAQLPLSELAPALRSGFGRGALFLFLAGVVQGFWNAMRSPARVAGNVHTRINWTAAVLALFGFVLMAATRMQHAAAE